ncbi:MAG: TIGR00282 family metallophosphoesterase [bacterium]
MKILVVGDILGKGGRKALRCLLPPILDKEFVDLVIGNVENVAGGMGVTRDSLAEVKNAGVQVMTSGNHVWKKPGFDDLFKTESFLLRPGNYPPGVPGRGMAIWETNLGLKVGVINLLGRIFMEPVECPFRTSDALVSRLANLGVRIRIVDFHAEATSEKAALGWYLDGRVSAVIGTHTHVQTADERVFPKGTGFLSDAGMTGSQDSVIGVKTESSLKRFLTGIPQRFEPSNKGLMLNGALLDVCESTGRCRGIRRIRKYLDSDGAEWNNGDV